MYSQYKNKMTDVSITRKVVYMSMKQQLLDEIVDSASKIPVECQERVLEVVKAMAFTREVMKKESEIVKNERTA